MCLQFLSGMVKMGMEMKSANHFVAYLPVLITVLFCSPPTEASKLVMSYVAAVCGKGAEVNQVKEQLLQSNPVLEGKNLIEHVGAYYLCVHQCSC